MTPNPRAARLSREELAERLWRTQYGAVFPPERGDDDVRNEAFEFWEACVTELAPIVLAMLAEERDAALAAAKCEASGSGEHNWTHSDEFTEKGREYDGWCNNCGSSAAAVLNTVLAALREAK